jgi:hypothetical protein
VGWNFEHLLRTLKVAEVKEAGVGISAPSPTDFNSFPAARRGEHSSRMSFAIEAAGEAAPLSPFELVKALSGASTSTDHTQRQSATQQLQTWEPHPDYYTLLQVT